MIINKRGICRTVLIFRRFVIKIPAVRHGQRYFVDGMLNNLYERNQYKTQHIGASYPSENSKLGKTYFCSFLGLFLIMERYELLGRKLKKQEIKDLRIEGFDNHQGNIGVRENGEIVLIDYGNRGFYVY